MNFNTNNYNNFSRDKILQELKDSFKYATSLSKLIYINLGVYLLIKLVGLVFFILGIDLINPFIEYLSVPTDMSDLMRRPWSVFTYMFVHKGFLHMLFNILWLYWFGIILYKHIGGKKLMSIYIIGGLTGAALYIFLYNSLSFFENARSLSYAYGSSASILAIIAATVLYAPNHIVRLSFIGNVKIKYIALVFAFIKILQTPTGIAGEHIIHLGGALYGLFFIYQLKKGNDISSGYNQLVDSLINLLTKIKDRLFSKRKMKVSYKSTRDMSDVEYNKKDKLYKTEINIILDKISKSGYDSLNNKEKEILFKSSK